MELLMVQRRAECLVHLTAALTVSSKVSSKDGLTDDLLAQTMGLSMAPQLAHMMDN
jgi:hypothetical protein